MNFDEAGVIAALARIFGSSQRGVEIGIGDDAAVVKTTDRTAITTDIAIEGTLSVERSQLQILPMFMRWVAHPNS
jgi:thiamine monophosphate kinase